MKSFAVLGTFASGCLLAAGLGSAGARGAAPPPVAAPPPSTASGSAAAASTARSWAILRLRQIAALHLTADEKATVYRLITNLIHATETYEAAYDHAAAPAAAALSRIESALLAGKTPDPTDEGSVRRAVAPLTAQAGALEALKRSTLSRLRESLTPAQRQVILIDMGFHIDAGRPATGPATGGKPGSGRVLLPNGGGAGMQPGAGGPALFGGPPNGAVGPGPGPAGGMGGPGRPLQLLDQWRRMPQEDYDNLRNGLLAGHVHLAVPVNGVSVDLSDPAVWGEPQGWVHLMDQIRGMTQEEWDGAREQIGANLSEQLSTFAQAHPGGNLPLSPAAEALASKNEVLSQEADQARAALEEDLIHRFFSDPVALRFLRRSAP